MSRTSDQLRFSHEARLTEKCSQWKKFHAAKPMFSSTMQYLQSNVVNESARSLLVYTEAKSAAVRANRRREVVSILLYFYL